MFKSSKRAIAVIVLAMILQLVLPAAQSSAKDLKDDPLSVEVEEVVNELVGEQEEEQIDYPDDVEVIEEEVEISDDVETENDTELLAPDDSEELSDGTDDSPANAYQTTTNENSSLDESFDVLETNEKQDLIAPLAEVSVNLVTGFTFSYTDKDGIKTTVTDGADLSVVPEDMNAVELSYTLVKPDEVDISPGDTYTLDLPEIYGSGSATNVSITVGDTEVATYSIVDGQVIITFNEHANSFDDAAMNVNISGSFNETVFETIEEVEIEVPYRDGTSFTATIKAEPHNFEGEDKKTAGKPYILDGDSKVEVDRNPTHIDWTVRVNDNMVSYTNAEVVDTLGDGLEIVEGSFVVERINETIREKKFFRAKLLRD